jgi:hypothetical protein
MLQQQIMGILIRLGKGGFVWGAHNTCQAGSPSRKQRFKHARRSYSLATLIIRHSDDLSRCALTSANPAHFYSPLCRNAAGT